MEIFVRRGMPKWQAPRVTTVVGQLMQTIETASLSRSGLAAECRLVQGHHMDIAPRMLGDDRSGHVFASKRHAIAIVFIYPKSLQQFPDQRPHKVQIYKYGNVTRKTIIGFIRDVRARLHESATGAPLPLQAGGAH